MATLLFVVAAATSHSQPAQPYWWSCAAPRHECTAHALKRHIGQQTHGFWQSCKAIQSKARCTIFPYWKQRVKPVARQMTRAVQGVYTIPMLVTYYLATGNPMSNGIMPSVGWAACGYDLPLGARVSIAGVPGTFVCGDRIGFMPFRHIDIFGIPVGASYREVTVFP